MPSRPHTEHELAVDQWQQSSYGLRGDRFEMNGTWGNHTHPDLELNLLLSGHVQYLHCGQRYQVRTGQMVAFWAGLPHGVEVVEGPVDFCFLTVPLPQLLIWGIDSLRLSQLLRGAMIEDDHPSDLDLLQVPKWITELDSPGLPRQYASLEVQARVQRILGTGQGQPRQAAHLVSNIIDWLGAHYAEAITIGDIAAAVECNPQQAMRSFKQATGITIVTWLNQLLLGSRCAAHAQHPRRSANHCHPIRLWIASPILHPFQ